MEEIHKAFNNFEVKEVENMYKPKEKKNLMKAILKELTLIVGIGLMIYTLFWAIANSKNEEKAEQQRRSGMYKYIGDESK